MLNVLRIQTSSCLDNRHTNETSYMYYKKDDKQGTCYCFIYSLFSGSEKKRPGPTTPMSTRKKVRKTLIQINENIETNRFSDSGIER